MEVPFGRDNLVSDPLGPRPRADIQSNRAARAISPIHIHFFEPVAEGTVGAAEYGCLGTSLTAVDVSR